MNSAPSSTTPLLPFTVRRRLGLIGVGWAIVAALEAAAYTDLAMAIAGQGLAGPVLLAAAAAMLVTVLVTRAGFLGGAARR